MSVVLLGVVVAMLLCAAAGGLFDLAGYSSREVDEGAIAAMVVSAAVAALFAAATWYWGREVPPRALGRREAAVAVTVIWFGISAIGALPFIIGGGISPIDALFESASGFTTTGATIVEDIEGTLSNPLLLWRSLIQWLGGMGVVVLFVAIFPNLGVSGKNLFRSEVPGVTAEGLQPRITETSVVLWRLYVAFTVAEVGCLWLCGMDLFDSVNHALTTLSTGGFSTKNASVAAFDSAAIDVVISVFMLAAAVNFGLYYGVIRTRSLRALWQSLEFRVYLWVVVITTIMLTVGIVGIHQGSWLQALRYALFEVATTITSTGYGTSDYMAFPAPALTIVILLMFLGGSTGSTAGGIKVGRIVILFETMVAQLRKSIRPQVVQVVRIDGKVLDESLQLEVASFFFLYMAWMAGGTLVITYTDGVGFPTAMGAMLTSLSNMGPAPFYEGSDNFASYTPVAKLIFTFAMVLGRLEFFTVMSLALPELWKR